MPAEDLSEQLSGHSEILPLLIPDPIEAMDSASKIANEEGCIVYVTGSVYLVGQAVEEIVVREGGDLWEFLQAHPPREGNGNL